MARNVTWINENVGDPRKRALERSRALSHAAKFSHPKNKPARQPDKDGDDNASGYVIDHSQTPLPLVAWKGNSDPFSSTTVAVTPRMHQAFEFLRDGLIPSTHFNAGSKQQPWSRRFLASRTMRKHIESMSDEWAALGEMLPLTAAISRLSGSHELQTETAKSKMKIIRRLQTDMSGLNNSAIRDQLISLTRTLFAAATFENNFPEARLHGLALRRLLEQKSAIEGIESIEISLIWSSLYYDAQISHCTVQLSIFDVDVWAPLALRVAARPVFEYLEPLRESVAHSLDPSLRYCPILKDVCIEIYQVVWLWGRAEPLSSQIDGPMMNVYLTMSHNLFQLKLSNHFVRLREALDDGSDMGSTQLDRHLEAAMTLSMIAYLALFTGNPRIAGQYMWPRVRLFTSLLHHHLTKATERVASSESSSSSRTLPLVQDQPQNMLLFALWVGATWEQNDALATADVPSWWFRERFVRTAQASGLKNWNMIRAVVDGFVPNRFAKPRGESWLMRPLRQRWFGKTGGLMWGGHHRLTDH
ncbi:uncharacterized protein AB675_10281 [Cyphellophora attinorum]|uniref:Uncharacterized protein n=1 Tax=Cyphellophora attinorum TaxID=1664694 RepID=A0A0N0NK26_9EURO|nr:uncharacterized protein AB675_10281 [Phialophora attinorum]KPI37329.1 hypothetical protein AB675_10281 [Phialophora attinorum]